MKKIGMLTDLMRSAFQRPLTECYPIEKRPPVEAFRGMLYWHPQDCTGCGLCVKDCPADAIELITIDKASKRYVFRFHSDRCTFCGQCAYNCRFDCIRLENDEWELAELDRDNMTILYGRPEDIERVTTGYEVELAAEPA